MDCATTRPSANREWGIKPFIVTLFIILFLTFVIPIALARFLPLNSLVSHLITIVIDSVAIFLLNGKYPLTLVPSFDSKMSSKYILIGVSICLFINYPHKIWIGSLKNIPLEYIFFTSYSLFGKVLFLAMLCLIGPFAEEVLFRGFFYRIIKNRYNVFWGALISTTVFTALHGIEIRNLVYIAIPSLVFTYVYEKSGSIWAKNS